MKMQDLKNIEFLNLDDSCIEKLEKYADLTLEANKKFNLTRNDNYDDFVIKNILDSLLIIKDFSLTGSSVLDLGSGAGLPGIPLAIYFKDAKFTLLEPIGKKANFLKDTVNKLELKNVEVVASRAEDFINENKREFYDFVVSRAVSKLSILSELSIPFLKVNGNLIAYKGENYSNEINDAKNALNILKSKVVDVKKYKLDMINETRFEVIILKNETTDKKYPRLYQSIKKRPL